MLIDETFVLTDLRWIHLEKDLDSHFTLHLLPSEDISPPCPYACVDALMFVYMCVNMCVKHVCQRVCSCVSHKLLIVGAFNYLLKIGDYSHQLSIIGLKIMQHIQKESLQLMMIISDFYKKNLFCMLSHIN